MAVGTEDAQRKHLSDYSGSLEAPCIPLPKSQAQPERLDERWKQ